MKVFSDWFIIFINDKLAHYADIVAIVCWILSIRYFISKPNRTTLENFLFLFCIVGFILDSIFSVAFILYSIKIQKNCSTNLKN